jgi:hypothetical protein
MIKLLCYFRCCYDTDTAVMIFSMTPSGDFFYVDRKLQQGFRNEFPFGAIPIAWFDPSSARNTMLVPFYW